MANSFRKRLQISWVRPLAWTGLWVLLRATALAQAVEPDASVGAALRNLASRSGIAFVGRVTEIDRGTGAVEVKFQVEQPLLGGVGPTYTLREWIGLWAAGQSRYSLGQRVVIFLHAPGKSGLSSPVDGMEGILPVVQETADSEPLLDMRRVSARVQRKVGEPIADGSNGAMKLADVAAVVTAWNRPVRPEPVRHPLPIGVAPIAKPPVFLGPIVVAPIDMLKEPLRLPVGVAR
jgi:hypothetical protein